VWCLFSYRRVEQTFDRRMKTHYIEAVFSGGTYDGITIQKLSPPMMISQWTFPMYFHLVERTAKDDMLEISAI
jgi:hypothetical protein